VTDHLALISVAFSTVTAEQTSIGVLL